jgi:hypothetical protein
VSRSPLSPLFRSETQIRVLTELFCGPDDELMISEIAERAGLPLSSVAREVHRLDEADVVRLRRRGRSQFVSPNRGAPWSASLTELLDRTAGPAAAIAEAFGTVKNVKSVCIFGSWAARSHGQPGAAPRDIDVVAVGTPTELAVSRASAAAERRTGVPVNALIVDPDEWSNPAEPDSFIASIKNGPLVLVIDETDADG